MAPRDSDLLSRNIVPVHFADRTAPPAANTAEPGDPRAASRPRSLEHPLDTYEERSTWVIADLKPLVPGSARTSLAALAWASMLVDDLSRVLRTVFLC
jgi:hypothetical protein